MNANENSIIRTVPAAGDLHKVPGFDPLKHLQKVVNGRGEQVFQLKLRYKRLWFRLACPSGRLLLNPLRITDQMAIFEAQVFFQREDPTPASSFTSTKEARETRGYIRAAQDEALSIALDNAGFGIQLCDVTQDTDGEEPLPEASRQQINAAAQIQSQRKIQAEGNAAIPDAGKQASAEPKTTEKGEPVQSRVAEPVTATQTSQKSADAVAAVASVRPQRSAVENVFADQQAHEETPSADPAPAHTKASIQAAASARQEIAPNSADTTRAEDQTKETPVQNTASAMELTQENATATVLRFLAQQTELVNDPTSVGGSAVASTAEPETTDSALAYTEDMSIEDISARMTLDEARKVVVSTGPCKGWTLEQVAERRPACLKFYVNPFCKATNIFKAAATLMLQEISQEKAG